MWLHIEIRPSSPKQTGLLAVIGRYLPFYSDDGVISLSDCVYFPTSLDTVCHPAFSLIVSEQYEP